MQKTKGHAGTDQPRHNLVKDPNLLLVPEAKVGSLNQIHQMLKMEHSNRGDHTTSPLLLSPFSSFAATASTRFTTGTVNPFVRAPGCRSAIVGACLIEMVC